MSSYNNLYSILKSIDTGYITGGGGGGGTGGIAVIEPVINNGITFYQTDGNLHTTSGLVFTESKLTTPNLQSDGVVSLGDVYDINADKQILTNVSYLNKNIEAGIETQLTFNLDNSTNATTSQTGEWHKIRYTPSNKVYTEIDGYINDLTLDSTTGNASYIYNTIKRTFINTQSNTPIDTCVGDVTEIPLIDAGVVSDLRGLQISNPSFVSTITPAGIINKSTSLYVEQPLRGANKYCAIFGGDVDDVKIGIGTDSPSANLEIVSKYSNSLTEQNQLSSTCEYKPLTGSNKAYNTTKIKTMINNSIAPITQITGDGADYTNPLICGFNSELEIPAGQNGYDIFNVTAGKFTVNQNNDNSNNGAIGWLNGISTNVNINGTQEVVNCYSGLFTNYINTASTKPIGGVHGMLVEAGTKTDGNRNISLLMGQNVYTFHKSSGNITNFFGLRLTNAQHDGTIVNNQTLRLKNMNYGGTSTNRFVIHSEDDVKSYHQGDFSIGVSTPHSSAKLQVDSSSKGFLPPVMNSSQKNLIAFPTQGLMVYDTDLKKLDVYSNGWDKGPTLVKILSKQASQSIPATGSGGLLQIGWDPTYSFSNNWSPIIDDLNSITRAKIYFPYVGYYQISSNLCFNGSIPATNVANQGYILYNSSGGVVEQSNVQSGNGSADKVRNTASYILKITDITHYLQLYAYQNTTSPVEIGFSGADKTFICIAKL